MATGRPASRITKKAMSGTVQFRGIHHVNAFGRRVGVHVRRVAFEQQRQVRPRRASRDMVRPGVAITAPSLTGRCR